MSAGTALVLAGGGIAGIAWETGVLRGIADESPAAARLLLGSGVLVGTSAGSVVAAQLGSGTPLEELFAGQVSETTAEIDPGVDVDTLGALFLSALGDLNGLRGNKIAAMRKIGAIALTTETVSESRRREIIARRLRSHDWPERPLRITAIDVGTGELVVFDRDSGVSLVDAVAASCAVPGAWPPVTIAGTRYMDGGVGSTVNMTVAADCAVAAVLVPSGADTPSAFGPGPAAEIAAFPGATLSVFADERSLAAFGPNPLDPRCRIDSAIAGREQGRREAGRVATFFRLSPR